MNTPLTNEKLKKKFKNNFELANYAIKLARAHIVSDKGNALHEIIDMVNKQADSLPKEVLDSDSE